MTRRPADLYGGRDPRDVPVYSIRQAAHHLKLPQSTLRLWVAGSGYRETSTGQTRSPAVIKPAKKKPWILSFWNLIEAQVLVTIRRKHEVSMQKVRKALRLLTRDLEMKRPLISAEFETDGVNLFLEHYGHFINASQGEITEMSDDLRASLERVERDTVGLAATFYPWRRDPRESRDIKIDPTVAFGRPVVAGTSLPSSVLAERYLAGDTMDELAADYDLDRNAIENACRWQLGGEAA